jgi:hypothetical protein
MESGPSVLIYYHADERENELKDEQVNPDGCSSELLSAECGYGQFIYVDDSQDYEILFFVWETKAIK